MTKRICALLLVCALAVTPASPAFASSQRTSDGSSQRLARALAQRVSINAPAEDVYDLASDISSQSGIPIVLEADVQHVPAGLTLGSVTLETALSALCQRFGWLGHVTPDGILILGPAQTMAQRYGTSGQIAFGVTAKTFTLRNLKAQDAERLLRQAFPGDGTTVVSGSGSVTVIGSADAVAAAASILSSNDADSNTLTDVVKLHYRVPSELFKAISGQVPAQGLLVTPDDDAHAIVLRGEPGQVQAFRELLAALDTPSKAVEVNITVYDYTPVNEQSNVGIEFGGVDVSGQENAGSYSTTILQGNAIRINARLNALVSQGRATVISRPNLSGLDNQQQKLQVGTTFYLQPVGGGLSSLAVQPLQVDTGVIGDITPRIGNGFVTLAANLQVSDIGPLLAGEPTVVKESVSETVRVKDGDAVVIGGMMKDTDTDTVTKIPVLGDLPVIGEFFRNRAHTRQRNQLVFVIQPIVLAPITETAEATK